MVSSLSCTYNPITNYDSNIITFCDNYTRHWQNYVIRATKSKCFFFGGGGYCFSHFPNKQNVTDIILFCAFTSQMKYQTLCGIWDTVTEHKWRNYKIMELKYCPRAGTELLFRRSAFIISTTTNFRMSEGKNFLFICWIFKSPQEN